MENYWDNQNDWNIRQVDPSLCGELGGSSGGNTQSYDKVPYGIYYVAIDSLTLRKSKKGYPMLTCKFNILSGEHKGRKIFMNSLLLRDGSANDHSFVARCNNFLRSLKVLHDNEIVLSVELGVKGYASLVDQIASEIKNRHLTFALDYNGDTSKNGKTYDTFTVTDTYSE